MKQAGALFVAAVAALAPCSGCGGGTPAPRVTYVATDGQRVSTGDVGGAKRRTPTRAC
jgi:hypothetical protein